MHLNLFVLFLASGVSFCVAEDPSGHKTSTTTQSTTFSSTTASTTTAPSTSASSTTAPSTTTPGSDSKLWFVSDKDVCILFAATINIAYSNASQATFSPGNHSGIGSVGGSCGGDSSNITIPVNDTGSDVTSVAFIFERNVAGDTFNITSVTITREMHQTETVTLQSAFWANNKSSKAQLRCSIKQTLFSNSNATVGQLSEITLSDMKLAVFQTGNSTKFNTGFDECSADTSDNNLVPIIVGAILGGLILVVLIAYLIGRRRNRRGYESV